MNKMIAKRYMVIKHIGQGGMADVYVAVDMLLNREVAVKVLRGELSNDPRRAAAVSAGSQRLHSALASQHRRRV